MVLRICGWFHSLRITALSLWVVRACKYQCGVYNQFRIRAPRMLLRLRNGILMLNLLLMSCFIIWTLIIGRINHIQVEHNILHNTDALYGDYAHFSPYQLIFNVDTWIICPFDHIYSRQTANNNNKSLCVSAWCLSLALWLFRSAAVCPAGA